MPLHSIVTTGSAIAALLPTLATSSEGFGLLVGNLNIRNFEPKTDTAEAQITQQQEACITAYICCPAHLSNTLVAGEPEVELLQAVQGQLQSDEILGWFAYRPVSSLQPTPQECMITSSMPAALNSSGVVQHGFQPIFAVLSSLPRHEGCSLELQQRLFCLNSRSHELEAVDLQVRNLGERGSLVRQYQPVMPMPLLPKVPAFTAQKGKATGKSTSLASSSNSSTAAPGNNAITEPMVRSLAHHGLQSQVDLMESIYRKAVRQLESLAHQAATDAA